MSRIHSTGPEVSDSYCIGFALTPSDPFWVQVREATKQRAAELPIELVRLPPLPFTPDGQTSLAMVEELRAQEHSVSSH